jgi:rare lipoprotein A
MKWLASLGLLALAGCAGGRAPAVPMGGPLENALPPLAAYDEVGLAGWYGEELKGRKTAAGEAFDPGGLTAAHRTLALRSYAEVTSLETGRTVLVRINDRGPYHGKRILDLSRRAAQKLGITGVGMVRVRAALPSPAELEAFGRGREPGSRLDAPAGLLTALRKRAGVASTPAAAAPLSASPVKVTAATKMPPPSINGSFSVQVASFSGKARAEALARRVDGRVESAGSLWRVRLGPFKTRRDAEAARAEVARQGFGDAVITDH